MSFLTGKNTELIYANTAMDVACSASSASNSIQLQQLLVFGLN